MTKEMSRPVEDQLMTVEELASFAHLSTSKIYHDVEAGKMPVRRWGKRQIGKKPLLRFKKSEILLWLDLGCPNSREFDEKLANLSLTGLP
jgi:predicted DNA-binding transcriptional regulator AlpA